MSPAVWRSSNSVIGDRLFNAYIRAPWLERLKRNSAELVRMADVGIAKAIRNGTQAST